MDNVVSRFLSFEETLGKGLVKFAYFVILIGLVVWAVIEIIGGVILLFDAPLAGLWEIVHTPFELALYVILLRVGTEVVLAILSIDDNLTESAVSDRLDRERGGRGTQSQVGTGTDFSATRTPSVTAAPSADDRTSAQAEEADEADGTSSASASKRASAKSARRTTKSAKKATKGGGSDASGAASSASTKATVKAASASPASARSDDTSSRGADDDAKDA